MMDDMEAQDTLNLCVSKDLNRYEFSSIEIYLSIPKLSEQIEIVILSIVDDNHSKRKRDIRIFLEVHQYPCYNEGLKRPGDTYTKCLKLHQSTYFQTNRA